jgi:hypothetical protein
VTALGVEQSRSAGRIRPVPDSAFVSGRASRRVHRVFRFVALARRTQRSISNTVERPAGSPGDGPVFERALAAPSTNDQSCRASRRRRSDFPFGLADSESGSATTRPVWRRNGSPTVEERAGRLIRAVACGIALAACRSPVSPGARSRRPRDAPVGGDHLAVDEGAVLRQ